MMLSQRLLTAILLTCSLTVHASDKPIQDAKDSVLKNATQQSVQDSVCSPTSLGLSDEWAQRHPDNFATTGCQIQAALGLQKGVMGGHKHGDKVQDLDDIRKHVHNKPTQPPIVIPSSPVYTTDLIKNATFWEPFEVVPPPLLPPTQRRQLAEIASAAALDYQISGNVLTYSAPDGNIDAQSFYNAAYTAYFTPSINTMRVNPGTYTVNSTIGGFHLIMPCNRMVRSHFEYDFGNSTFIFTDGTQGGVFFAYCLNITAHSATFMYNFTQNPWYQATVNNITNLPNNQQQWTITVQDGYPTDFVTASYQALCVPWDPDTRLPRRNATDIYPNVGQTTLVSGRTYQFMFGYTPQGISIGDFITCRGNRGNHGIIPWYNEDSTFTDFTFYNPAIFGIYEETGSRNTYINNKITRYPYPVGSGGAREAPLQSSLADGFHAGSSFVGPTLIGNTFEFMGDDGIALHGHYYLVVAVDRAGGNITVANLCGYDCSRLFPNKQILSYKSTTERLGYTTILAVNLTPNPLAPGTKSQTFPYVNLDSSTYVNITISCWPPAYEALTFDSFLTSRDNEGDGFVAINNTIAYNRGRGVLLKASNGVLSGNTFTEPKFIAAQITPELYWQEGDYTSNTLIDNNTFDSYYGGITLGLINDNTLLPGTFQNHINVTISNNIIRNAADQALLITSATNITVTGNTFDSVLCYPYTRGAALPFIPTPQPPIYAAYSSNLNFSNNTYIVPSNCTYGNFTSPIQFYQDTVTNANIA